MIYDRSKHGALCARCPLRDRRRVWSELADRGVLGILGEAPGAEEDASGRPFVGAAGRLLNAALAEAGIERFRISVCNVIACRPTANNMESAEAQEAIECCANGFSSEMEFLKSSGLRVIVPLGNHALSALGLPMGITRQRGSVLPLSKKVLALPTFHPAFLLRGMQKQIPTFIADLRKAHALSKSAYRPPKERFLTSPTLGDVETWVDAVIASKSLVAVDIETTGLRPDKSSIFVVGLARSGEEALSIPFLKQGYKAFWLPNEVKTVKEQLQRVLAECPLVFQNALFDVMHLRYHGYEVKHVTHDILLAHHCVHPELPHDLGYIVSIYGNTPYWKDEVHFRDGRLGDLEDETVRVYNLRDAVVLHQVLGPLLNDLKEAGTEATYTGISLPLVEVLVEATLAGIQLDADALRKWKRSLARKLKTTEAAIRKEHSLPEGFSLSSGDHLRLLLYGHASPQFVRVETEMQEYDKNPKKRKDTKKYKEILSRANVYSDTVPLWKPPRIASTDGGKYSVDEEMLLSEQLAASNRLALIEKFVKKENYADEKALLEKTLAFLAAFHEWQETSKLISTYTDFPCWSDGRVHTSFKIHGTKTGRLASDSPNMQNIPKSARCLFTAGAGSCLVEADYSNLEPRVLAYLSNDAVSLDIFKNGKNIHDENTKALFPQLTKEDALWKDGRKAAKKYRLAKNYLGGDQTVYRKVYLEAPALNLSFQAFKAADEAYQALHAGETAWIEATAAEAVEKRRLANAFGRIRLFLGTESEVRREGVNFPVQGTAADIISQAMISLHADFKAMTPRPVILLQVHDSLLVECSVVQRAAVKRLLKKHMEREFAIGSHTVHFPVEITSGRTWGTLK
jgi:uracil-DNA glycosylase family 4